MSGGWKAFAFLFNKLDRPSTFDFYLSCLINHRLLKKFFPFLFFLVFSISSTAQTDSCGIRISLLTCTPGTELYSTFGHSALRVVDSINNTDLVFNYGTFDYYDPDFYTKIYKRQVALLCRYQFR